MNNQERAVTLVLRERDRQDAKWGDQSKHPNYVWSLILGEEVGEVAKEVLQYLWDDELPDKEKARLLGEVVQVAAVALAWVEKLLKDSNHDT